MVKRFFCLPTKQRAEKLHFLAAKRSRSSTPRQSSQRHGNHISEKGQKPAQWERHLQAHLWGNHQMKGTVAAAGGPAIPPPFPGDGTLTSSGALTGWLTLTLGSSSRPLSQVWPIRVFHLTPPCLLVRMHHSDRFKDVWACEEPSGTFVGLTGPAGQKVLPRGGSEWRRAKESSTGQRDGGARAW